jgi:glyoxylase-like metal-dependent hydrolase (beta-lactamase superfamily II)
LASSKIVRLNESVYRLGPIGNPQVLSAYLIVDESVAVVDCGPATAIDELLSLIEGAGVSRSEIDYLLLTHIHLDHAGGTAKFIEACQSSKVVVPQKGLKHLLNPVVLNSSSRSILGERIFNNWGSCESVSSERVRSIEPNEKIRMGQFELKYLSAPGHAPHHNVLFDADSSIIFSADALGIYEERSKSLIPTTPPPSFDLNQALDDIEMIRELHPHIACMSHFKEIILDELYFSKVSEVFRLAAKRASDYVEENGLMTYSHTNCEQLFSILKDDFPQYSLLSEDMKDQATRVDAAGLLNYYIKRKI